MEDKSTVQPLTIVDLKNLLAIVDHAFEQGAFKGLDNTRTVLQNRDKLAVFLAAAEKATASTPVPNRIENTASEDEDVEELSIE